MVVSLRERGPLALRMNRVCWRERPTLLRLRGNGHDTGVDDGCIEAAQTRHGTQRFGSKRDVAVREQHEGAASWQRFENEPRELLQRAALPRETAGLVHQLESTAVRAIREGRRIAFLAD
jgi:hypothetical protein